MGDGYKSPTLDLVTPLVKLELLKRNPEAFFLMANSFLGIDELLLFYFHPFLVEPDTVLDIGHVAM